MLREGYRRVTVWETRPQKLKDQRRHVKSCEDIDCVVFSGGENKWHNGDLAKSHDQFEPLEIEVFEDNTHKRHRVDSVAREHEIPTTIGGINTEENVIQVRWRCPTTARKGNQTRIIVE
jgi:acetate kinase